MTHLIIAPILIPAVTAPLLLLLRLTAATLVAGSPATRRRGWPLRADTEEVVVNPSYAPYAHALPAAPAIPPSAPTVGGGWVTRFSGWSASKTPFPTSPTSRRRSLIPGGGTRNTRH